MQQTERKSDKLKVKQKILRALKKKPRKVKISMKQRKEQRTCENLKLMQQTERKSDKLKEKQKILRDSKKGQTRAKRSMNKKREKKTFEDSKKI